MVSSIYANILFLFSTFVAFLSSNLTHSQFLKYTSWCVSHSCWQNLPIWDADWPELEVVQLFYHHGTKLFKFSQLCTQTNTKSEKQPTHSNHFNERQLNVKFNCILYNKYSISLCKCTQTDARKISIFVCVLLPFVQPIIKCYWYENTRCELTFTHKVTFALNQRWFLSRILKEKSRSVGIPN